MRMTMFFYYLPAGIATVGGETTVTTPAIAIASAVRVRVSAARHF